MPSLLSLRSWSSHPLHGRPSQRLLLSHEEKTTSFLGRSNNTNSAYMLCFCLTNPELFHVTSLHVRLVLKSKLWGTVVAELLYCKCPSCCPNNSIKALKAQINNNNNNKAHNLPCHCRSQRSLRQQRDQVFCTLLTAV